MPVIAVRHVTTYRYKQPVAFGPHRMMFRPRESYDQRLLEARIEVTPTPTELRYVHDVFGNSVGIAHFSGRASELTFVSHVRLEQILDSDFEDQSASDSFGTFPFAYSSDELPDLSRSIERQFPDPERKVELWAHRFIQGRGPFGVHAVLGAMTRAIPDEFTYVGRPERGTQSPIETLELRRGTCRDFAVFMIEAARSLGLAARFVSGYLHSPSRSNRPRRGGGNTHAWVRIYLPEGGWVEYDPTNGIVGNRDLIRVAVVRDPKQAVPLSGTWRGFPSDYLGMEVEVDVRAEETAPALGRAVS
jgi:transglutaminase-like putative cysteine protease